MTLGLNVTMSSGDDSTFTPLVIYLAKAGRLYKRDRVGGANGYENFDTEIPEGSKFAFDFGSLEVGWLHFAPGMAPSFAVTPIGGQMPEQPTKDHRQGFRSRLWAKSLGGTRELAGTAKTLLGAIDELHTKYEASPEAATGKIPVVVFAGSTPITTVNAHGKQVNFRPLFEIVQWIDRPADLGERTVPPPNVHLSHHGSVAAPKPNGGGKPVVNAHPAQQANPRHVPPPSKAAHDEWDAPANAGSMVLPPVGSTIDDDIPF